MIIHKSWTPICTYCGQKIRFKFDKYGHVCVNEECNYKDIPLYDMGYRNSKSEGWCCILDDRNFAMYKKPYDMKNRKVVNE